MWLLNILPDWIVGVVLTVGIVGIVASFLGSFFPPIKPYATIVQLVSAVLIGVSVYWYGGLSERQEWEAKVSTLEKKVADAEKKSAETNTQIITKYITRTKKIQGKRDEIIKYVDREIVKYDNQCVIPKEVIDIMNEAAKGAE